MSVPGLTEHEVSLLASVFQRHPEIVQATLFGSRARGTHTQRSDVDIALEGTLDELGAQAIAAELDELPMPYQFDVQALNSVRLPLLREHILQFGVRVYPPHSDPPPF